MNREIKFRYVFKRKSDGHIYIIETKIEGLEETSINGLKSMFKNGLWELIARDQFTGLLDKNGKEIYESDVVRIWADPKHYGGYTGHDYAEAVVWNPQEARFELTEHGFYDFEFIQVIGNIHENKELLA